MQACEIDSWSLSRRRSERRVAHKGIIGSTAGECVAKATVS